MESGVGGQEGSPPRSLFPLARGPSAARGAAMPSGAPCRCATFPRYHGTLALRAFPWRGIPVSGEGAGGPWGSRAAEGPHGGMGRAGPGPHTTFATISSAIIWRYSIRALGEDGRLKIV